MIGRGKIGELLADVVARGDFTVPPYPAVAVRLQRLLASDAYNVADVADVLASDAALAATILAAANSAAHSSGFPITSLSRAVNRLGARTVGAIAVASGLSSPATASGALLDVKFRIWRRTLIGAIIAQKLAPARGLAADEAFLSGLLHGFGRSIAVASLERLLTLHPDSPALTADEWISISEQQRAPLANRIAQVWQLPEVLARAIENERRGDSALSDLVLDADSLALEFERGDSPTSENEAEAVLLDELEVGLPIALEAFMSPRDSVAKGSTKGSSLVTKPGHALSGELRAAALRVCDSGAKRPVNMSCLTIGSGGLEVQCSMRYQECSIVRLRIGDGDDAFEPWFTVLLCVPDGQQHKIELQLFSPTREVRERWRVLYENANLRPSRRIAYAAGGGIRG